MCCIAAAEIHVIALHASRHGPHPGHVHSGRERRKVGQGRIGKKSTLFTWDYRWLKPSNRHKVPGLEGADADVTRLRLGLEGTWCAGAVPFSTSARRQPGIIRRFVRKITGGEK